jgi:glycosyltransferase involved in cell wall biosynthesis
LTLSVIIPAHNEEQFIGGLLDSLLMQSRLPDEIVVVCDSCTDNTRGVVEDYARRTTGKGVVIHAEEGLYRDIAGSRNHGLIHSRGDILVCLDSDTALTPHGLEAIEHAVRKGYDYGSLRLVPAEYPAHIWNSVVMTLWLATMNRTSQRQGWFYGTGVFFTRTLMDAVGPYDPNWGWAEDIELSERFRAYGAKSTLITGECLYYSDRRFAERGYLREVLRRWKNGMGHLRKMNQRQNDWRRK